MSKNEVVTKSQLIDEVAKECDVSKAMVNKIVDSFFDVIEEKLAQEQKVALVGYITFSTVMRAARNGRNPSTGKEMKIPAKKVVKAKLGKKFKEPSKKSKRK